MVRLPAMLSSVLERRSVLILAIGVALLWGLLWALGYPPGSAGMALFKGAFGSEAGWMSTLRRACPLLLAGLGVALAFQAGLWNIGAEGQLILGASAAAWAALRGGLSWPLALACAMLAGGAGAAVAGQLRTRRGVPEAITTILLNFLALEVLSYLVLGPLREAAGTYPQTDGVPEAARLPLLLPQLHLGLGIGLLAAGALHLFLFRSSAGLELRALGSSPGVALHMGVDVARRRRQAMFWSGALAGLAGGVELLGVTHRLFERFSPGYGYTAIAVALLGRLRPWTIVPAAVFFGALEAGASQMQREAGVPAVLVTLIQGLILLALILRRKA